MPEEKIFRPHSWAAFGADDIQAADYAACKKYKPMYAVILEFKICNKNEEIYAAAQY